jgi:hypothetical protein
MLVRSVESLHRVLNFIHLVAERYLLSCLVSHRQLRARAIEVGTQVDEGPQRSHDRVPVSRRLFVLVWVGDRIDRSCQDGVKLQLRVGVAAADLSDEHKKVSFGDDVSNSRVPHHLRRNSDLSIEFAITPDVDALQGIVDQGVALVLRSCP